MFKRPGPGNGAPTALRGDNGAHAGPGGHPAQARALRDRRGGLPVRRRGGRLAGVPAAPGQPAARLAAAAAVRVLADGGLPAAPAPAPHPHAALPAGLLHRPHAHQRRPARRPRQPRPARQRGPDPRDDGGGRVDEGRRRRHPQQPPHRLVDADPEDVRRGAGEPAAPVRPAAGLRLPAGGGRQPGQTSPRALLADARRLVPARRLLGRLAGRRHLRPQRRAVLHDVPGDAPDRRRHRHRARLHRREPDLRRRRGRGGGDPELLQRLPLPQRRRRLVQDRRSSARRGPHRSADATGARGRRPSRRLRS